MGMKEIFRKLSNKNAKYKEMDEDNRLNKTLHERQLSPQERDLNVYLEKERQKQIKVQLAKFHQRDKDEFWRNGGMSKTDNVFKGHNNILQGKKLFPLSKGSMLKRGQL